MGSLPTVWGLDTEHRLASLAQPLFFFLSFGAISPAQVLRFSRDTMMENTAVFLTRIATDSFSHGCSQNLYLASFPQVPAGQRFLHRRPLTLLWDATMQSHTAAFSFLIASCPFRPGRESRKQSALEETPRAEALGSWVWILGLETGSARTGQQYPQGPQQPSDPQL